MSFISIISLVGIFVLLPLLVRSRLKGDKSKKAAEANDQYSVIEANSSEMGHQNSYLIPKDPDEYARMFVPKSKKPKS